MNDQAKNLRKKMGSENDKLHAKTIAIISGKGGVGKSNVALNFSLELINQKKKVIIIDLDVGMGNINILLGLESQKTILNLFEEELTISDIIQQGPNGLAYIAGGTGLTNFFLLDEQKKKHFFKQYDVLTTMFDYIVFDMGAGATQESLFFILAADECFVVTTPEPTAITDAYSMIKHVVNKEAAMRIHVILNRVKSQKEGKQTLDNFKAVVEQFLKIDINLLGILPEDGAVTRSVISQTPYMLLNKKPPIARAIGDITENYLYVLKDVNVTRRQSFIQKLKTIIAR